MNIPYAYRTIGIHSHSLPLLDPAAVRFPQSMANQFYLLDGQVILLKSDNA